MRDLSLIDELLAKVLDDKLSAFAAQIEDGDGVIDHISERVLDDSALPVTIVDFDEKFGGNIIDTIGKRSTNGVCILNGVEGAEATVVETIIRRGWMIKPGRRLIILGRSFDGASARLLDYLLYVPVR